MQSEASTASADQDRGRTVEELERELAEAQRREAATAEILKVISVSPNDLEQVMATVAQNAASVCNATDAHIFSVVGDRLRIVAAYGSVGTTSSAGAEGLPLTRGTVTGRAFLDQQTVHVADLAACLETDFPDAKSYQSELGFRTTLATPLVRWRTSIGAILIRRMAVDPFSDKQIEMLETFADQAVIAIENTRLFEAEQARTRELTKSLEYQTAISDVLAVIGSSPNELQPVFDAIVRSASRLCGGEYAIVTRYDGALLHLVAQYNPRPATAEETARSFPRPARREASIGARALLDGVVINIADVEADDLIVRVEQPTLDYYRRIGLRALLAVPMIHEGRPIGTIVVSRGAPGRFTERQIELLKTFADQAVIAIENTRLFEEVQARTRELSLSLEQQTATAEVLQVISSSPTNVQPVFDTIVRKASSLCGGEHAIVTRYDGTLLHLVAQQNPRPGAYEETAIFYPQAPRPDGAFSGRALLNRAVVHLPDIETERLEPSVREAYRRIGLRAVLCVPMVHEGQPVGVISVSRGTTGPFSDSQIDLLKTFADQAVIAIANTRLFEAEQSSKRELQEALEYQTATSDVLGVIAASPTNIQPALQTLVESACRLCGAYDGIILLREGDWLQVKAHHGPIPANLAKRKITRDWVNGRCVADGVQIHLRDLQAETIEYPEGAALAQRLGARTILSTPLMREGEAIGALMIRRDEVRPFSDKQIGLVETFADQAVIAIENTRLFEAEQESKRELQKSLEYQTATSGVLETISRSPTDVRPVFDMIAQSAARLCEARFCNVFRFDGKLVHYAASYGTSHEEQEALRSITPLRPSRAFAAARAILNNSIEEIPDISSDPDYAHTQLALAASFRSTVAVPMRKDGLPIGAIAVVREIAGTFPKRQIELLKTFADQAVIAIENTRLFEAEQTNKRELQASLEYQTATSDVLSVISRSAFELQVVLDALVVSATRLCNADHAWLFQRQGDVFRLAAIHGTIADTEVRLREYFKAEKVPVDRTSVTGRTALEARVIHIPDVLADPEYTWTQAQKIGGYRAALGVPLLLEGSVIGVIFVGKADPTPFAGRQVELVSVFADQAVIAIENTRLFEEVQARTRELAKTVEDLEIASQHKSQFVANMSHELRTPLAAILGYAELMQEGFYGALSEKSTDALTRIRSNGKHLLGLINTVLDIAKIESGQFSLNLSEYAIENVIETVRSATESLAETKKLSLKTEVAKRLPVGLGDEQRLTQVLLNLVGNAIKFTDTGEVRISATAMNGNFTVAVTDTGPGIPERELKRVFEQFHQIDNSNTKAKGGTGLGLAIAKQIVEMHGGRIWVESTLGQGATFQMQFPMRAEFRKVIQ